MLPIRPSISSVTPLFAVVAMAAASPALAQELRPDFRNTRYVAAGWVGNVPDALIGGGVAIINPTGIGFFANVKLSDSDPGGRSNFMADVTVDQALNEFGDFEFEDESHWLVISGGLVRTLTADLALYGGAGLSRRTLYREFEDPDGVRGELGYYWVEDPEYSGDFLNLTGGLFFRAGHRLIVQFGAESQPRGMTVGLHFGLPR